MAEATRLVNRSDFNQTSSEFVEWFTTAHGTRLNPKVQLKDLRDQNAGRGAGMPHWLCVNPSTHCRSLVAKETIAEDEELFAIPRSLVLTTTTSSIPPEALELLKDTGAWLPLIVTIIYEFLRKEKSPWHSYFQVLPTTFESLMFWNTTELAELQASAVVDKIGKRAAEESWKETIIPQMLARPDLYPVTGGPTNSTAELIKLAHMAGSLIMAYAFDIDRDDEKSKTIEDSDSDEDFEEDDEDELLKGMVPFADMLNADADRNNVCYFEGSFGQRADHTLAGTPLPRTRLSRHEGHQTNISR